MYLNDICTGQSQEIHITDLEHSHNSTMFVSTNFQITGHKPILLFLH